MVIYMLRQKISLTIVAILLITTLAALPTIGLQTTITNTSYNTTPVAQTYDLVVPDDFPTIQQAIDHAHPNGKIRVKEGIYNENILINKKGLIIEGDNPYTTIIDGGKQGDVVTIDISTYEFDQEIILKKFTITNSGINYSGINITSWGSAIIKENIITKNGKGITVFGVDPNYNTIYHNNIVNNLQNAYDQYYNHWYSVEASQGNYWSDYQYEDVDGDGYGDRPYRIPGGMNTDYRPKMTPYVWECPPYKPTIRGPSSGKPNQVYTYKITTTDENNDKIKYVIHWGDEDETTDFYDSGEEIYLTHSWANEGSYVIRVKAIDDTGLESDYTNLDLYVPKSHTIFYRFPFLKQLFAQMF